MGIAVKIWTLVALEMGNFTVLCEIQYNTCGIYLKFHCYPPCYYIYKSIMQTNSKEKLPHCSFQRGQNTYILDSDCLIQ